MRAGMRCETARQHFSDLIDGGADQALQLAIEHHFSECHACEDEFNLFRKAWQMMDELPLFDPPASLHGRVMSAVRQIEAERSCTRVPFWQSFWQRMRQPMPARVAVAWSAAAIIGLAVMGVLVGTSPDSTSMWPVPVATVNHPATGLYAINVAPALASVGSVRQWEITVSSSTESARVRTFQLAQGEEAAVWQPWTASTQNPASGMRRVSTQVLKGPALRLPAVPVGQGSPVAPALVQLSAGGQERYVMLILPSDLDSPAVGVRAAKGCVLSEALCQIAGDCHVAIVFDAGNDAMVNIPAVSSPRAALESIAKQVPPPPPPPALWYPINGAATSSALMAVPAASSHVCPACQELRYPQAPVPENRD